MRPTAFHRPAFTIRDLFAVLVVLILILAGGLVVAYHTVRRSAMMAYDEVQLRSVAQGLIVWAQNNTGDFPLPQQLDKDNATTAEVGAAKNHTANIYSLLIYNGFASPNVLVSPAEVNRNIKPFEKFQFSSPSFAVNPNKALWDPAFTVDFTKGVGGASYACLQPTPARYASVKWSGETTDASRVVLASRGPRVTGVSQRDGSLVPTVDNPASNSFRMYGDGPAWKGHFAFNDGRVDSTGGFVWQDEPNPPTYTTVQGQRRPDVPYYDEPDDATGDNSYVGLFTTAGERAKDFVGIWD